MRMRKYLMLTLIIASAFLSSCKKWLTVQPETEVTQDVLFSSESGFKDALMGVYMLLKSDDLYGANLSFSTMDRLVNSWDVTTGTTDQYLGQMAYQETGVQNTFTRIFGQQYKAIANVNQILTFLETNRNVFKSQKVYDIIKSECLAIRAFCHFDLLRIFGPVPGTASSNKVLPYVTQLATAPNSHLDYQAFKSLIFKDLDEAENLVKDIDPFLKYSAMALARPGDSGYSDFDPKSDVESQRFIRFNYYGIKAIKARAYLWFEEPEKAFENARVVIDAKNADNSAKFPLGTPASFNAGDYNLSNEHIIGLYDHNLRNKYETYFTTGSLRKGSTNTVVNTQLYGNTGTDMREIALWTTVINAGGTQSYIIRKFGSSTSASTHSLGRFMLPLIRISEMYLIAAEAAPSSERQQWWNTYRVARNLGSSTLPADEEQLRVQLAKEYNREFIGEGQAFFAYKRVNAGKSDIIWTQASAAVDYVVPLPLGEFFQ